MKEIDGSFGEGGGQILRTSLGLSLFTGIPFHIKNIRGKRKKGGLLRQHLTAINAAKKISNAEVKGNDIGSTELWFYPGKLIPGRYDFKVGTAGSATLVFQSILPALLKGNGEWHFALEGGTHNPYAPPFDFLEKCFLNLINKMGVKTNASFSRFGFFPAGNGRFEIDIYPTTALIPLNILKRGQVSKRKLRAICSHIPLDIGKKETLIVSEKLKLSFEEAMYFEVESAGPGNVLMLEAEYEEVTEVFTSFGEKGLPLKKVARDLIRQYENYDQSGVPVGRYLADQLLIPIALAGKGSYLTMKPSLHTTTNLEIIRKFTDIPIELTQINPEQYLIKAGE